MGACGREERWSLLSLMLILLACLAVAGCSVPPRGGGVAACQSRADGEGGREFRLHFEDEDCETHGYYGGQPGDIDLSLMTYPLAEVLTSAYVPCEHINTGAKHWYLASARSCEELARFLEIIDSERTTELYRGSVRPVTPEDALRLGVAWLYPARKYETYPCPLPIWRVPLEPSSRLFFSEENPDAEPGEEFPYSITPFWARGVAGQPAAELVVRALEELRPEADDVLKAFCSLCLSDAYAQLGRYKEAIREAEKVETLRVTDSLKWSAVVRQIYCHLSLGDRGGAERVLSWAEKQLDRSGFLGFMFEYAHDAVRGPVRPEPEENEVQPNLPSR